MLPESLVVFFYALGTALTTGIGAVPFFFVDKLSRRWLGLGTAIAAGCMAGASVILLTGGGNHWPGLIFGLALGAFFVWIAHIFLDKFPGLTPDELHHAAGRRMMLIITVMTVHSLAEGIGIGVSFGHGTAFGILIAVAMAIHNIPEGLAISLVLVPRGVSAWGAVFWSIFSSIPQLLAVVAFLFVERFQGLLPIGLGFAAGAMFWMVWKELLPEARNEAGLKMTAIATVLSGLGIILLERLI